MKIINGGRGVHQREIVGIDKLRKLPNHWYAFTNLDIAVARGKSREIDVIIVSDERIFLIDLKDWNGRIESREGNWFHNGKDRGYSPVSKIHENAKELAHLLHGHLNKQFKGQKPKAPKIQGLVVITTKASLGKIAPTEIGSVISIDDFLAAAVSPAQRVKQFGPVARTFVDNPITAKDWKHRFSTFFNARSGHFKPGQRNYGGYLADSDAASFEHPVNVYAEYDATDDANENTFGTLRLWDFTKVETRFQNADARKEIAGREQGVIAYLRERSEDCELAILQPKIAEPEQGVGYWEVYERRRRMKRLSDFISTEARDMTCDQKVELVRQLLSKASALHNVGAAHLDLGAHSIWLQQPSSVRLSHFMAASYPQVESLGEHRYQFLACTKVPEAILGHNSDAKRKDVYLLGIAAHYLLFGVTPKRESESMPPEWSPEIDHENEYSHLHSWFERMLELSPAERFADASESLHTFNLASDTKPTAKDVIVGLEAFSTKFSSQMQLFEAFPPKDTLRDDARLTMWISESDTTPVLVKIWRRACWGDQTLEGPRILDFLQSASEAIKSPVPNSPCVRHAVWLGDSIALVQDWIDAPSLRESIARDIDRWKQSKHVVQFLKKLTENVLALHESGHSHGDLKPENILVTDGEVCEPIFVDLLDFSPSTDGEIVSSAYCPAVGGRFERNRFAVTKIAEDLVLAADIEQSTLAAISLAIVACRNTPPENGSLVPLRDALGHLLNPTPEDVVSQVNLSIRQSVHGPILPDEGLMYFRAVPNARGYNLLSIRGAGEELEVEINQKGKPFRGRRRPINQKAISLRSKYEFTSKAMQINIVNTDVNEFSELSAIIEEASFKNSWDSAQKNTISSDEEDEDDNAAGETQNDAANDRIIERASAAATVEFKADVGELWRRLIEVESELTIEGVAREESTFRKDSNRHLVPIELTSGTFDFTTRDRVLVEKLNSKGQWWRIGYLDVARSKLTFAAIDITRIDTSSSGRLVEEGQRLRFTSHFEQTSLDRREKAIRRILTRQSRVPDLLNIFDFNCTDVSTVLEHRVQSSELETLYKLNEAQATSMEALLNSRPVGLLQGPPGTGKTVFIAALVHYALSRGLARNVLLASQSHEAVNNTAESVLKLFGTSAEQPSIIRVGAEGVVSDRLLPFHTERVEQLYKDKFQASIRERLLLASRSLGLSQSTAEKIIFIETTIRPVVEKLIGLENDEEEQEARIQSIRQTILSQAGDLSKNIISLDEVPGTLILDHLVTDVRKNESENVKASPLAVSRLRSLARIAHDFISSAPTRSRNFETFLAGTREIVAGTCVGLGRSSLGLTTTPFDLVVVDEAARCTASELSVPIQAGRWIVLVGDQEQLLPLYNPVVVEQVSSEMTVHEGEILRSDFERAFSTAYGRASGQRLVKQYRMLPPIGRIVSSCFYGGALQHGRNKPVIDASISPYGLDQAISWIETDSLGTIAFQRKEVNSKSLENSFEVEIILALLRKWDDHEAFSAWLMEQEKHEVPIGIICGYAAQRDLLRKKLQTSGLSARIKASLKIGTVDSYQGKENRIIILSLVRNNEDGVFENGVPTIKEGFLAQSNRVNVAISRAMDRLVIVGASRRWREDAPMGRVAKAFREEISTGNARLISPSEIIEPPDKDGDLKTKHTSSVAG